LLLLNHSVRKASGVEKRAKNPYLTHRLTPATRVFSPARKLTCGQIARCQALNNVVARVFASAGVPVTKEPVGLERQDGKQPDGLILIPWPRGNWKALDLGRHMVDFYVSAAASSADAAAEQAADQKSAKHDQLVQSGRLFQPIAAEMLGPLNESTILFFCCFR